MSQNISENLKKLRKKKGYTQSQLAEGICTQAMISNFEKGESIPSSLVLFELSEKLNIDINYFFKDQEVFLKDEKFLKDENKKTKNLIRKLVKKKDYESIYYIINSEIEKNNFVTIEDKQFLIWHESISEYYLFNTSDKSIKKLKEIIQYSKNNNKYLTIQDINIMNSLAIIYFEIKKYDLSFEKFNECLLELEKIRVIDFSLKIRVLYGFSRTLSAQNNYELAIINCRKAIKLCIENEVLYLLGELHFQIGRNFIMLNKYEEGKMYLEKAKVIFEIEVKDNFLEIINLLYKEIEKGRTE